MKVTINGNISKKTVIVSQPTKAATIEVSTFTAQKNEIREVISEGIESIEGALNGGDADFLAFYILARDN